MPLLSHTKGVLVGVLLLTITQATFGEPPQQYGHIGSIPCPIQVYCEYNGKLYPQIGSWGKQAQALVDGEKKIINKLSYNALSPVRTFGEGFINIHSTSGTVHHTTTHWNGGDSTSTAPDYTEFRVKLEASTDMENVSMAVLSYNLNTMDYILAWNSLGALKAGKVKTATARIAPFTENFTEDAKFFPLFFVENKEIMSSGRIRHSRNINCLLALGHAQVMEPRTDSDNDNYPVTPYITPNPFDPSIQKTPPKNLNVAAKFTILEDGHTSDISIEGNCSDKTKAYLKEQIAHWVYIPKIKNGTPTSTKVKLPIRM